MGDNSLLRDKAAKAFAKHAETDQKGRKPVLLPALAATGGLAATAAAMKPAGNFGRQKATALLSENGRVGKQWSKKLKGMLDEVRPDLATSSSTTETISKVENIKAFRARMRAAREAAPGLGSKAGMIGTGLLGAGLTYAGVRALRNKGEKTASDEHDGRILPATAVAPVVGLLGAGTLGGVAALVATRKKIPKWARELAEEEIPPALRIGQASDVVRKRKRDVQVTAGARTNQMALERGVQALGTIAGAPLGYYAGKKWRDRNGEKQPKLASSRNDTSHGRDSIIRTVAPVVGAISLGTLGAIAAGAATRKKIPKWAEELAEREVPPLVPTGGHFDALDRLARDVHMTLRAIRNQRKLEDGIAITGAAAGAPLGYYAGKKWRDRKNRRYKLA